ncbi:hypothetical protein CFK35_18385, partial [Clostridium sp. cpc1]|uniref:hypothetical protein n=1 Tax=Clostridium sp. cpc1 TaxID=2016536 RepID=UPI00223ED8D4
MVKEELKPTKSNKYIDVTEMLMNLNELEEDKLQDEGNKDSIDFYFISKKKSSDGKSIYNSYSPSISEDIQKKIKEITINRVSEVLRLIEEKEYIQDDYNPCGQIDG